MAPCFFERTAAGFVPTTLPLSPWNPDALNGVAVAGLLATLVDGHAAGLGQPMSVARLTIDLLGTVPAGELLPTIMLLRGGSRMQLVQAELAAAGRAVARAQALFVREHDTPDGVGETPDRPPEDYAAEPRQTLGVLRHTERRTVAGRDRAAGPGVIWVRFDYEVVAGTPLSPLARAAMAADYPGGIGNMLVPDPYSWPNLDITLYMIRAPVGDWVRIEAHTESSGNGAAVSSGRLADRHGTFARAHQTIFVERAEPPAHIQG